VCESNPEAVTERSSQAVLKQFKGSAETLRRQFWTSRCAKTGPWDHPGPPQIGPGTHSGHPKCSSAVSEASQGVPGAAGRWLRTPLEWPWTPRGEPGCPKEAPWDARRRPGADRNRRQVAPGSGKIADLHASRSMKALGTIFEHFLRVSESLQTL